MRADGSTFPAEVALVPLEVGQATIYTAFIRDISERKRNEATQLGQNRILSLIATGAPLSNILDEIARFIEVQYRHCHCAIELDACSVSGFPQNDLASTGSEPEKPGCGSYAIAAQARDHDKSDSVASLPAGKAEWMSERTPSGAFNFNASSSWPILGKDRTVLGKIVLHYDETGAPTLQDLQLFNRCTDLARIAIESRASEERMRYLAHYDGLTNLPNRFLFREFLDLALRNGQRHGRRFAVMFIDFDRFKEINDTFGHEAGDTVLCEISARLRHCLRSTDKIARMGGDEFYILIDELTDTCFVRAIAQKLLAAAARPVRIGQTECQLSVSIGIVLYPGNGMDAETLLKNADTAMYRAKELGKNRYHFHNGSKYVEGSMDCTVRPARPDLRGPI
jgi:diguanylate cyclase (GGDEF)-like protein